MPACRAWAKSWQAGWILDAAVSQNLSRTGAGIKRAGNVFTGPKNKF
jgi:hypothetical protein